MHRASAISLLAAIGFSLIAPGILLDEESNLPACCRRNGAHHCMMNTDAQAQRPGTSVQAVRQTCPSFQLAATVPARTDAALSGPPAAVFAALLSYPSIHIETEARHGTSVSRSHQKRGPPFILS